MHTLYFATVAEAKHRAWPQPTPSVALLAGAVAVLLLCCARCCRARLRHPTVAIAYHRLADDEYGARRTRRAPLSFVDATWSALGATRAAVPAQTSSRKYSHVAHSVV
jgi:hypothetical protein